MPVMMYRWWDQSPSNTCRERRYMRLKRIGSGLSGSGPQLKPPGDSTRAQTRERACPMKQCRPFRPCLTRHRPHLLELPVGTASERVAFVRQLPTDHP